MVTHALIVGISKYSFNGRDLKSPVPDALLFAEWALERLNPRPILHLYLSPLDDQKQLCDATLARLAAKYGALNCQLAESKHVEDFLDNLAQGDLLLIYWSGHGVVNKKHDRYLLYADTTDNTLRRHFDVRNTLQYLSDKNFPVQIGFFDTCATSFDADLGANQRTVEDGSARQSYVFAASAGQAATEMSTTAESTFSAELLKILKEESLPLNEQRIIGKMQKCFENNPSQRPQYYALKPPDNEEQIGGNRPSSIYVQSVADKYGIPMQTLRQLADLAAKGTKLATVETRDKLFQELRRVAGGKDLARRDYYRFDAPEDLIHIFAGAVDRGLSVKLCESLDRLDAESLPARTLLELLPQLQAAVEIARPAAENARRAYYCVAGAQAQNAGDCESVATMIWRLAEGGRLEPVAEFFVHLAAEAAEPLHSALLDWARPLLGQRYDQVVVEAEEAPSYLFIDVERPDPKQPEKDRITAFLRRGSRTIYRWSIQSAPADFNSTIDTITYQAEKLVRRFFVQLLVSREMFDANPHRIPIDDEPLGTYFPVALRWRERVHGLPRTRSDDWIARAEEIREHLRTGSPGCQWCDPATNQLTGKNPGLIGFEAPLLEAVRKRVKDGAPFATWPESAPVNVPGLRKSVEDLASCAKDFDDLPSELQMKRKEGTAPEIALFWDDPRQLKAWRLLEP